MERLPETYVDLSVQPAYLGGLVLTYGIDEGGNLYREEALDAESKSLLAVEGEHD